MGQLLGKDQIVVVYVDVKHAKDHGWHELLPVVGSFADQGQAEEHKGACTHQTWEQPIVLAFILKGRHEFFDGDKWMEHQVDWE